MEGGMRGSVVEQSSAIVSKMKERLADVEMQKTEQELVEFEKELQTEVKSIAKEAIAYFEENCKKESCYVEGMKMFKESAG